MNENYRNLGDEELLHKIALKQDKIAFEMLYHRYAHLCIGLCMKYFKDIELSKDATQNIFTKLWSESHKYQVRNFKSWFYKVTRNHCLMELRKSSSTQNILSDNALDFMEFDEDMHHKFNEEKLLNYLTICMDNLNPEQKLCIDYFYLRKKSYSETAEQTGFTDNQVKSYLQNGKRNLKICLANKWQNHG